MRMDIDAETMTIRIEKIPATMGNGHRRFPVAEDLSRLPDRDPTTRCALEVSHEIVARRGLDLNRLESGRSAGGRIACSQVARLRDQGTQLRTQQ